MRNKDVTVIRDATARAFAAQVRRDLDAAREKGWKFPAECDVAVKVINATALRALIHARIDEVGGTYALTIDATADDVKVIVGKLAEAWLAVKGTRP